ncbi:hypothetical protein SAMN06264365_101975 [Actinoplanes regularis]|uniref:Uncharacterized protein n=1 Tax=Actinoplanes regularis TaxID=52697 RepID=A0A238VBR8_9ACTN|nr:hypothetical protein SAMN06264365_101975 [Actinoplanes regularis]
MTAEPIGRAAWAPDSVILARPFEIRLPIRELAP